MTPSNLTRIAVATLAGFGLGAAVMYALDPVSGKRRRALARDKATSAVHHVADTVQGKARDLSNRARGVAAETRGALNFEGAPTNTE